ncbi:MAG: hypothetical protein ACRC92_04255 [Peptostreptococcaceae bacterium]
MKRTNLDLSRVKNLVTVLVHDLTFANYRNLVEYLYSECDAAHGPSHIYTVLGRYFKIYREYITPKVAIIIAFHDIGNLVDRKEHHNIGAELARECLTSLLSEDDVDDICLAIQEHRASFKGEHSNWFSEMIATCDRGEPDDISDIVVRSYKYARDKQNQDHVGGMEHALLHVKEKYGRNGYMKIPNMYKAFYGDKVEAMYNEVEALSFNLVRNIIEGGI